MKTRQLDLENNCKEKRKRKFKSLTGRCLPFTVQNDTVLNFMFSYQDFGEASTKIQCVIRAYHLGLFSSKTTGAEDT